MAGTMGAFGGDLSSIGQMLDRRQQNAQFLRSLISSEMEQARQAQRQNAALQLQRELGLGSLNLDRDRFGFEQELGRGAQSLNRDRFGFEQEMGRGQMGLAGQRFGLEQELGRGQQDLAGKKLSLDQELGRGGLANAMGRLQLDERSANQQFGLAERQLGEQARQFDEKTRQEMAIQQMMVDLQKALPGIQNEETLRRMAQEAVLGEKAAVKGSELRMKEAEGMAQLGANQRGQEIAAQERQLLGEIFTKLRALPEATDETAKGGVSVLAEILGIKLPKAQPAPVESVPDRPPFAPSQAPPMPPQPVAPPMQAAPPQPVASTSSPAQAANPMRLGSSAPAGAVKRFEEYSRWLANLEAEIASGGVGGQRLRFLTSTAANVRSELDKLLGAYGGG